MAKEDVLDKEELLKILKQSRPGLTESSTETRDFNYAENFELIIQKAYGLMGTISFLEDTGKPPKAVKKNIHMFLEYAPQTPEAITDKQVTDFFDGMPAEDKTLLTRLDSFGKIINSLARKSATATPDNIQDKKAREENIRTLDESAQVLSYDDDGLVNGIKKQATSELLKFFYNFIKSQDKIALKYKTELSQFHGALGLGAISPTMGTSENTGKTRVR